MSEPTPEAVPATETTTPSTAAETPSAAEQPKPTETVDFWKQKAREQEQRAKSNAQKAQEFDALQESQKTEAQKLADRAAAAERERDEARAERARYKAAATHGIAGDDVDLLTAPADEDSLLARAERIGGLLRENAEMRAELEALRAGRPAPAKAVPTEQLKPGATPENTKTEDDVTYESLFGSKAS